MSSEGSVTSNGSQIRQFGLYRTIDARTEEFLRSSRKRQIKQGCACAAISTAITVTVVVSVILVYEYSINSEANVTKKNSVKPHWIGFMNDSDITSISSKFNKKINFDRTTLKLLPILLKALNKNRYLEKILEEYSGSSTPYIGKETTEATFTRNIFSDSKNWLKLPTTRHYTLDYKTSPLTFWKNPTKRLEYLTKIRKIRDYQRMLNYFDKMVNDRVGQKKEFDYTENPLMAVTEPMKKIEKISKIQAFKNFIKRKEFNTKVKEDKPSCTCPKKLGLLLSKLITSLQDVVPQMIKNNFGFHTCEHKTKPVPNLNQFTTARPPPRTKPRISDLPSISMGLPGKSVFKIRSKFTTNSPKAIKTTRQCCSKSVNSGETRSTSTSTVTKRTSSTKTTTTTESTTVTKKTKTTADNEFQIRSIKNSIINVPLKKNIKMSNCQTQEKTTSALDLLVKPTMSPYDIETTRSPEGKRRTTETIVPIKFVAESYTDEWLKTYPVDSPYSRMDVPLFREEDYEDYNNNKPSKSATEFENIDVQSMETLKAKAVYSREDIGNNDNNLREMTVDVQPIDNRHNDLDLTSMRKLADMVYIPQEKTSKVWKYTIDPELSLTSDRKYKNPIMQAKFKISKAVETYNPTTSNILSSAPKKFVQIDISTPSAKNDYQKSTPCPHPLSTDPQIGENVGDEELQEQFGLRPTDNATPYKYKNSSKKKDNRIENKIQNTAWELMKNEEKIAKSHEYMKSMLPSMRPIYLEIQRNNEWRQDEHGDYDIYNFNNNIFDLPNI